jgi:hypothetical protein
MKVGNCRYLSRSTAATIGAERRGFGERRSTRRRIGLCLCVRRAIGRSK